MNGCRIWTISLAPSVMAAREFARQANVVGRSRRVSGSDECVMDVHSVYDLTSKWLPVRTKPQQNATRLGTLSHRTRDLVNLTEDDRARYLAEALEQADGIPGAFVHLLGMDSVRSRTRCS